MNTAAGSVVIIGAGPAGLAAAVRAAEHGGRRVILIDQGRAPGGQIWRADGAKAPPYAAAAWIRRVHAAGVDVMHAAEVVDARPGEGVGVASADGGSRWVSAADLVLATGARELFLPFPGWTLPGVTGAAGLQALVKQGANVRGRRVVLSGTGPLLLPAAATLARHGAEIAIVAEQTPAEKLRAFARSLWRTPWQLAEAAALRAAFWRTPYRAGTWVTRADGDTCLREVTLTNGRRTWTEQCDFLACGYGLVPNTELARLLGCVVDAHGIVTGAEQGTSVAGVNAAGECTGVAGAAAAIAAGERVGRVLRSGRPVIFSSAPHRSDAGSYRARLAEAFAIRREVRALATPETIVCRCEDVRMGDLAGARDAREAKLHTRAGMGACQGRVCGAALEALKGWPPGTARPPLYPVPVAMLAPRRDERA
jgi:thioredoxin reductase